MQEIFKGGLAFNQEINSWQTEAAKNFTRMFARARAFNQPLNSWRTGKAVAMAGMFAEAKAFDQNIDAWLTGNATNVSRMFYNALVFNQNISAWQTASVLTAHGMFDGSLLSRSNFGCTDECADAAFSPFVPPATPASPTPNRTISSPPTTPLPSTTTNSSSTPSSTSTSPSTTTRVSTMPPPPTAPAVPTVSTAPTTIPPASPTFSTHAQITSTAAPPAPTGTTDTSSTTSSTTRTAGPTTTPSNAEPQASDDLRLAHGAAVILALGMLCIAAVLMARGIETYRRAKGQKRRASAELYAMDATPMLLMNAEEFGDALSNETRMSSHSPPSSPNDNDGGSDGPITRSGRVKVSRAVNVDPQGKRRRKISGSYPSAISTGPPARAPTTPPRDEGAFLSINLQPAMPPPPLPVRLAADTPHNEFEHRSTTSIHLAVRRCSRIEPSPFQQSTQLQVLQAAIQAVPPHQPHDHGVNAPDAEGRTPLMYASQIGAGGAGLVRLLCRNGANVGVVDSSGMTAFMIAAIHGHADVAAALAEVVLAFPATASAGTDVGNTQDAVGLTALHWAVRTEHLGAMRALSQVCDARLMDAAGHTIIDYMARMDFETAATFVSAAAAAMPRAQWEALSKLPSNPEASSAERAFRLCLANARCNDDDGGQAGLGARSSRRLRRKKQSQAGIPGRGGGGGEGGGEDETMDGGPSPAPKVNVSCCILRPRTTPFPEEISIPWVIYGGLLWADMNAATPPGSRGRSVLCAGSGPAARHRLPASRGTGTLHFRAGERHRRVLRHHHHGCAWLRNRRLDDGVEGR